MRPPALFLNANGQTHGRTDGRTDGHTDIRTDTPSYRDATAHLKTLKSNHSQVFKNRAFKHSLFNLKLFFLSEAPLTS